MILKDRHLAAGFLSLIFFGSLVISAKQKVASFLIDSPRSFFIAGATIFRGHAQDGLETGQQTLPERETQRET